ncbi:MAG: hypothetical protein WD068_02170 [Candidatus Babeliales bacterium]
MMLLEPLVTHITQLHWQDYLEITLFSALFYYSALWLKKDSQKNILIAFYAYCTLWGISYYMGLLTICSFLITYSPLILTLLAITHQHTLQKNLIALHKIEGPKLPIKNWIDTMMRTILVAVNNGTSITCIIERKDGLSNLITAPFFIQAPITEQLLAMIFDTTAFDTKKMIWLQDTGTLHAINAHWNHALETPISQTQSSWHEDALLFTAKTDALVIHADTENHLFTIITHDTTYEQLMATQARDLIIRTLSNTDSIPGEKYAHIPQKHSSDQPTH